MAKARTADTSSAAPLASALGFPFRNKTLLREALTHPSLEGETNYQRLEFLGDRVLGLVIGRLLFETFPGEREGQLSRRQAQLVRRETLAGIAKELGLPRYIRMTAITERGGGRESRAILSDVLEALIGVMFLEGGLEAADQFIRKHWAGRLKVPEAAKDPKSALQEWAQGRGLTLPAYSLASRAGPDHAPRFTVTVSVEGRGEVSAEGTSKQEAEVKAAKKLLAALKRGGKSKK